MRGDLSRSVLAGKCRYQICPLPGIQRVSHAHERKVFRQCQAVVSRAEPKPTCMTWIKNKGGSMKIDEGTHKAIQGHLGYTDEEMALFMENPRNLDVMSKAPALMG